MCYRRPRRYVPAGRTRAVTVVPGIAVAVAGPRLTVYASDVAHHAHGRVPLQSLPSLRSRHRRRRVYGSTILFPMLPSNETKNENQTTIINK